MLAAFYGRTAEEISRSEAIPLGTAKTRIRLGLRRVRALMTPAEEA
jgi:DNA-directed RNA polymerase specialized sigma24 family protein